MRKPIFIRTVLAILLLVFLGFAVHQAREQKQLDLRGRIELKSKEAQLIELDNKYDELLNSKSKDKDEQLKKIRELEEEKERLEAELSAKRNTPSDLQRTATITLNALTATNTAHAQSNGSCEEWMSKAGIPKTHATTKLILKESSCNPTAQNPRSSAYGIGQFLDATWSTVGCVKTSDPVIQLKCMQKYIDQRYQGSWEYALSKWYSRCGSPQGCWY